MMVAETNMIIVGASFVTAAISGMMGMGGGTLLLTVMINYFPPTVLIPIHGMIQLLSNTQRLYLNREHLVKSVFFPALLGATIGGFVASFVVLEIPENVFKAVIGIFILLVTWLPIKALIPSFSKVKRQNKFFTLGLGSTFLAVFIGAVGPLVAPFFLHEGFTRKQIVATKAAFQINNHAIKTAVFFSAGFAFAEHLPLILMMSIATVGGTFLGKLLLGKLSDRVFYWVFRGIVTISALRFLVGIA